MQAVIGLAGVVIGAALAPLLDLVRQRRTDRRAWQRDLRELAAALIAHSGDQLVAQTDSDPSASTSATAANAARWRIQLIAPGHSAGCRGVRSCHRGAAQAAARRG